jgi:hypothetical protein
MSFVAISGTSDLRRPRASFTDNDMKYYIGTKRLFANAVKISGASWSDDFAGIGDIDIYFDGWIKIRRGEWIRHIATSRVEVIRLFGMVGKLQQDMFAVIAKCLPQPIAEAIEADFAGWMLYDIASQL